MLGVLRKVLFFLVYIKVCIGFSSNLHSCLPTLSSSAKYSSTTDLKMGLRSFIKKRVINRDKKEDKNEKVGGRKELVQQQRPQGASASKTKKTQNSNNSHSSSSLKNHGRTRASTTTATFLSKRPEPTEIEEEEESIRSRYDRIRSGKLTEEEKEAFVRRSLGIKDPVVVDEAPPPKAKKTRIRNPMFEELIAGQTKDELMSDLDNQKLEYVKMITNPNRFSKSRKKPHAKQFVNSPLPSPSSTTKEKLTPSRTTAREELSSPRTTAREELSSPRTTARKELSSPRTTAREELSTPRTSRESSDNDLGARLQAEAMAREQWQQELRKQAEEQREMELRLKAEAERCRMEAIAEREYEAQLKRQKIEEEEAHKEEVRRQIEARKQAEILARQEEYWNNKVRMERESRKKESEEKKEKSKPKAHINDNQSKTKRTIGRSKITKNLSSKMSVKSTALEPDTVDQLAEIERAKKEQVQKLKALYSQTEIQQRNEEEQELHRIKEEQAAIEAEEQRHIEEEEQAAIKLKEEQAAIKAEEEQAAIEAEEQRRLEEEEQAAIEAEEQRRLEEENQRKAKIEAQRRRAKEKEDEKEKLRLIKAREQAEKMAAQEEYWKNKVKKDRKSRVNISQEDQSKIESLDEEEKAEFHETDATVSAHQIRSETNASESFPDQQKEKTATISREKAEKMAKLKSLNSPLPSMQQKTNLGTPLSSTDSIENIQKRNERSVNFRSLMKQRNEEDAKKKDSTVASKVTSPSKTNLRNLMKQRKEDNVGTIDNKLDDGNSQYETSSSLENDINIQDEKPTQERKGVEIRSEVESPAPKRISLRNILAQKARLDSDAESIPQNDYEQTNTAEISAPKPNLRDLLRKQAEQDIDKEVFSDTESNINAVQSTEEEGGKRSSSQNGLMNQIFGRNK